MPYVYIKCIVCGRKMMSFLDYPGLREAFQGKDEVLPHCTDCKSKMVLAEESKAKIMKTLGLEE